MSLLRVGIIGCGGMAENHARRFEGLRERMRVTAAVDVVQSRAQAVAAVLPGAQPLTDYRQALDDMDAALIVLPHHLHASVAIDCLKAGKHVILEKPMANTEQDCLDIIAAAERAQRTLMIAYCMRYEPCVLRLKELLDEKAYGDCFQLSIWTEQHTEPPPGHWANTRATLGGGQFFSHGCHYIDLLLWLLGEPETGCHIGNRLGTPWMEGEGTSNVILRFASGAMGYHFGTWGARGSRLRYSFHAHCTKGLLDLRLEDGGWQLTAHRGGSLCGGREEETVLAKSEAMKATAEEMAHFLDCVETGAEPRTHGRDSLTGLRAIWRLYAAEACGKMADLRGLSLTHPKGKGERDANHAVHRASQSRRR